MALNSINPRTGAAGAEIAEASTADVARAAAAAAEATAVWRRASGADRARVLDAMADALAARRDEIVRVADEEAGLGAARFNGELDRTTGQLRAFAEVVRNGDYVEAILTPGDPAATPPRPDLRRLLVPLGPVGVFTPSNFPLAFGVAGGDTASALAAGCAVVVKGHPSHPRTSALCAETCAAAAATAGAPDALLGLVQGGAPEISRALVQAPEIRAIGFTGSLRVGRLLHDLAAARPEPIPFYGELGSLNPVFVGPAAMAARPADIAAALGGSVTLGTGQFCTKPGLVFVATGAAGDALVDALAAELDGRDPGVMLNAGLRTSLDGRVRDSLDVPGVVERTQPRQVGDVGFFARPRLLVATLEAYRQHEALRAEHFGPVALVVRGTSEAIADEAGRMEGQLTATLLADPADGDWAARLLERLDDRVGRIVWNGVPTGVAVVPAMHHGGPYPASTNALHTSVGATAIRRFLRPVAYQAVPDALLPPALQDANPLGLQRRIGGEWTRRPLTEAR